MPLHKDNIKQFKPIENVFASLDNRVSLINGYSLLSGTCHCKITTCERSDSNQWGEARFCETPRGLVPGVECQPSSIRLGAMLEQPHTLSLWLLQSCFYSDFSFYQSVFTSF
jgi:hypothetical protein